MFNSRSTHAQSLCLLLLPSFLMLALCSISFAASTEFPLELVNLKSGISVTLSGRNGSDWAVERTYHDDSIGDQIVYMKADVEISLCHNERNVLMIDNRSIPRVLGVNGPDGKPNSGDEGDIYYKLDRDMQSHLYSTKSSPLPGYCVPYVTSFRLGLLTYDGTLPVVGTTGDNGAPWGSTPRQTTERFAYGQRDSFGNEWHTLTYWDDDEPLLKAAEVDSHRQGASDGHCIFLCVNPVTPVVQLQAEGTEQFYTTPVKTYHVPVIREQTTYLTSGVRLHLLNLAGKEPVQYRVAGGAFRDYGGEVLRAGDLFTKGATASLLELRCGPEGVLYRRAFVLDPVFPALDEQHGCLLWADEAELKAVQHKVHDVEPFKRSYAVFHSGYTQSMGESFDDTRGGWRDAASQAAASLANAFVVAMDGTNALTHAHLAKQRLLRLARLQPVGYDVDVNRATPAKDFLNELGQTIQSMADAGVAYDLLAAHCRLTHHPEGMTPIEEMCIREGLAKIAKSTLQFRGNWSASSGGGDAHWPHGYEQAMGLIALAMPTYKSSHYGVSGGNRQTVNDLTGVDGLFWNPFPDQGVTWYQAATDPTLDTPGHPNVVYPFRANFIYTDDGWWTGPNDLQGDGSRYFTGPAGNRLVDIKYGGMGNAECRVEMVEMSGYESPFVERTHALDIARRIKGDANRPLCLTQYIRRRLLNGVVPLSWDAATKTYSAMEPRIETAIYAFNNHYPFASLPRPRELVGRFLENLKVYYGVAPGQIADETRKRLNDDRKRFYSVYALALCAAPEQLVPAKPEPNMAPILKPLFKHVVRPGEQVRKDIIAVDPNGDALTVTVENLPDGAIFEPATRRITWIPGATDAGVHMVAVTASDGRLATSRPFAMIVKPDAPAGPVPAAPSSVAASVDASNGVSVTLTWQHPSGVDVAAYVIYRDGAIWAATDGAVTTYEDSELMSPDAHTRYHVAVYDTNGAESTAAATTPAIIRIPADGRTQPVTH